MKHPPARMASLAALFVTLFGALCAGSSLAQQFPTKPMSIIVPFPPGGIIDTYSRIVGNGLQQRWGQSVVIENRPGAGGWIGIQSLAKATPDGHTLLATASPSAALPAFIKGSSFEPGRDLEPLTGVLYAPYVIITNTQTPAKSLGELLAHAKNNPGKLNFAVVPNSGQHVDTIDFLNKAGVNIVVVPYAGGAAALRSILANEAQVYFGAALGLEENVRAGKLLPLAVTSALPFARLPDVPTVKAASGIDFDSGILYALFASPGTAKPVLDKLHKEIVDIAQTPDVTAQFVKLGYEVRTTSREALAALLAREGRRAVEIARAAKIEPQ